MESIRRRWMKKRWERYMILCVYRWERFERNLTLKKDNTNQKKILNDINWDMGEFKFWINNNMILGSVDKIMGW